MTVQELEDKVWEQDSIRVVVRAPAGAQVGDYTYQNAAQANWRITEFLEKRLAPVLGTHEVVVLMGDGEQPHGRTLLSSIRDSYRAH
jgi:hypothetical protein